MLLPSVENCLPVRSAWLFDRVLLCTVLLFSAGLALPGLLLLAVLLPVRAARGTWGGGALRRPLVFLAAGVIVSALASPWREASLAPTVLFLATSLVSTTAAGAYGAGGGTVAALVAAWIAGAVPAALAGLAAAVSRPGTPATLPGLGANGLGTTLALAASMAVAVAVGDRSRWRWAAAGVGLLLAGGLAATYARGAWAALTAGSAVVVLAVPDRRRRWRLAGGLALVLALAGAAAWQWPPLRQELASIPNLAANRNRLVLWATSVRMFAAHPVLGTGFGTFQHAYARYRPPDAPEPEPPFAHNLVLNFLVETGVVGTAGLVTLCGAGLRAAWRWTVRSPSGSRERTVATAVLAALVTLLVTQMFDGTVLSVHLGFGFFALLALAADAGRAGHVRRRDGA
ncbi:MAG: O-antigen ligase family protein [Armatimonadota bacterium]|nr:O-antigen ligase family protein [Armatimonadota bacterium]